MRRLRQRWRWVPLPIRLRFAQIRNRWIHRRAAKRALTASFVVVVCVLALTPGQDTQVEATPVAVVQDGHRVVSVPINEGVPPLLVGDMIDLYVSVAATPGAPFDNTGIELLDEAGLVVEVTDSALAVAVPEEVMASLATALAEGDVLVVRR